jgi:diaminopimelate decarboxylase
VYCEQTLRTQARAFRAAAPDALVVYGTKAFANVALLRLFAEEGLGADVSTLGELTYAQRGGIPGANIVFHGNNKSDEELLAAVHANALVVLDAEEELERATAAGVTESRLRTPSRSSASTRRTHSG